MHAKYWGENPLLAQWPKSIELLMVKQNRGVIPHA